MATTDRQRLLEIQRGKPIRQLIEETLRQHRGDRLYAARTAVELDVSPGTLRLWTGQMGIDLRRYAAAAEREEDRD